MKSPVVTAEEIEHVIDTWTDTPEAGCSCTDRTKAAGAIAALVAERLAAREAEVAEVLADAVRCERKACAQVAEDVPQCFLGPGATAATLRLHIVEAIRARGEQVPPGSSAAKRIAIMGGDRALEAEVQTLRERDEAHKQACEFSGLTEQAVAQRDEAHGAYEKMRNLAHEAVTQRDEARAEAARLRAWEAEARAAMEAVRNGALRVEDYDRLSAVLGGKP